MLNKKGTLLLIIGLVVAATVLAGLAAPAALAATNTTSILGQVTVNGTLTNGVTVTCSGVTNTTTTWQGQNGVYILNGVPDTTGLSFKASYPGYEPYVDTVDLPGSGSQYYEIPTVDINRTLATPTPTPAPNATATPAPNATATPAPNATVTPTPAPSPTAAPNATVAPTPVPATPTPAPAPVPQATTPPPATAVPTSVPSVMATSTVTPTLVVTLVPTLVPSQMATPPPAPAPTQTKSPGFEGAFALACVLGIAYLMARKRR